jgi:Tfp pilus assembly major pilin PilA
MNYWKSFKGFTVAELATTMGVIALAAVILTPAVSGTVPASVEATITTVSESSAAGKTPVKPPVTEVLVTITNKITGVTRTQSVDPDANLAEFTGLDAQADYDVTVAKKSTAGTGAAAAVEIGYDNLATQTKEGTRDIQVNDTTKPIHAPDTTKPIYEQVDDTTKPIYERQDQGYWSSGSYWVAAQYGTRTVSSTCYSTHSGQSCSSVYSHYACFNSACTRGAARYTTQCSNYSYQVGYSCSSTQSYLVRSGYNQSYSNWVSNWQNVRVGYEQKSVISGYETKITGYTQKTVAEDFDYEEPVMKAVVKTAKVKAPAGQLIIEADGTPSRSWRWATGTIVGKGAGTSSNYTLDGSVSYRLGTPFTVSNTVYSHYACFNTRCTSGAPRYTTTIDSYVRVPALSYLVR